ncbi:MAG: hypothetical protein M1376_22375 [Planctomycetes bacterium]|nr:hypothetical protein [Planctomycetota bacterium]
MNLGKLRQWLERKPLILLRFEDGYEQALRESKHGIERFTVVRPHEVFEALKPPTLCLAEMPDGQSCNCYVGVVRHKAAVATFESRLTIVKLKALNISSLESLVDILTGQNFKTLLEQRLATGASALGLSPKLSVAVIDALCVDDENRKAIERAAFNIPGLYRMPTAAWEQLDAIRTAMAAFGLSKAAAPELVEVPEDSDSTLSHLEPHASYALEDNVIAKDASVIPGFSLIEKHVTGRAVFLHGQERLEVYTANRGPLETMLGVDLVYVNRTLGNMVMVQYKMLEEYANSDAAKPAGIFRPDDQLQDEMNRMKLPPLSGVIDDYRLYRSPFFFKFVERRGDGEAHQSFVISLDHLNHLLASPKSKGPKGGVRVSYNDLAGVYLRESDLIGLIRSGYIGTHRAESDALYPIISEVAGGNRGLVLAWQRRIAGEGK